MWSKILRIFKDPQGYKGFSRRTFKDLEFPAAIPAEIRQDRDIKDLPLILKDRSKILVFQHLY